MNASPESLDLEVITRFLRRFADLMSNGSNSENLLRAAGLLETTVKRADEAEQQLRQERSNSADIQAQLAALSREAHASVPVSILRLTASQFESMARTFEKSGDIVSQAMCEASAQTLGRLLEADASPSMGARAVPIGAVG